MEMPVGTLKQDEDATWLFYDRKFSDDTRDELWIQCAMFSLWAHNEWEEVEMDAYVWLL